MTEICVIDGCAWNASGTISGAPEPLCRGYGGPRGCMADWLSTDPEDLMPYADYVENRRPS